MSQLRFFEQDDGEGQFDVTLWQSAAGSGVREGASTRELSVSERATEVTNRQDAQANPTRLDQFLYQTGVLAVILRLSRFIVSSV